MTANALRSEILNTCKYCKQFTDRGRNRHRYQCDKYFCSIYEAHGCSKTKSMRDKASEIGMKAVDEALIALMGMGCQK